MMTRGRKLLFANSCLDCIHDSLENSEMGKPSSLFPLSFVAFVFITLKPLQDSPLLNDKLRLLLQDFLSVAEMYGKIIILERSFPLSSSSSYRLCGLLAALSHVSDFKQNVENQTRIGLHLWRAHVERSS